MTDKKASGLLPYAVNFELKTLAQRSTTKAYELINGSGFFASATYAQNDNDTFCISKQFLSF
jgi:hypothetical protein